MAANRKLHTVTCKAGKMYHNGEGYVCDWSAKLVTKCGAVFEYTGKGSMFDASAKVRAMAIAAGHK